MDLVEVVIKKAGEGSSLKHGLGGLGWSEDS